MSGDNTRVLRGHPLISPNLTPQLYILISSLLKCFKLVWKNNFLSEFSIGKTLYPVTSLKSLSANTTWKWRLFAMQSAPIESYPILMFGLLDSLNNCSISKSNSSESTWGSPSSANSKNNEWFLHNGYWLSRTGCLVPYTSSSKSSSSCLLSFFSTITSSSKST